MTREFREVKTVIVFEIVIVKTHGISADEVVSISICRENGVPGRCGAVSIVVDEDFSMKKVFGVTKL